MIHYKTYIRGDAYEWVTFVHGAGGSSSIWYKQIKAYKEHFNILLVDLRGHGKSKQHMGKPRAKYTFEDISKDIIEVLKHENIASTHFVAVSLGTIIVQIIAELAPQKIRSMVLAGAVTKLNLRSQILIALGNLVKHIVPYMWLYKLFAWVIMPRERHHESRSLFVREAKKLCQKEFKRWFRLTYGINAFLAGLLTKEPAIPALFIMGDEDYMFLPSVQSCVSRRRHAQLCMLDNCGHVVNVDQPEEFNRVSIGFIRQQAGGGQYVVSPA
ncbi:MULTISPECIES: alpha/beta fold hydrolase [Brevibacillus]|uniref:alpha/beta fold hydrolase n=1 Tax=Brevibacillus TaxID=55080 RepID=UPI000EE64235|nr:MULTISPECIES: alpha/beta hydrolase [Brevibacillus]MDH6352567.1 pimeloyl-ACP methyl ester carboxylesterase [Brevibacillus sp. 1238]MDR4998112.1 alpha/beta hydrolase [Brevibacillus parabrevis]HBZ83135.1 2-succinyl-6-hydroxy-2,4-cyclohexadiene-1-carboxylate synthase [Brevibacillus sp.]